MRRLLNRLATACCSAAGYLRLAAIITHRLQEKPIHLSFRSIQLAAWSASFRSTMQIETRENAVIETHGVRLRDFATYEHLLWPIN
jgi:hypothetical protein